MLRVTYTARFAQYILYMYCTNRTIGHASLRLWSQLFGIKTFDCLKPNEG